MTFDNSFHIMSTDRVSIVMMCRELPRREQSIYRLVQKRDIVEKVELRRLSYFGHVARMN